MNTSTNAASASSRTDGAARRRADAGDDLDTRILEAERAVIERDERVVLRAQSLLDRGQRVVHRAQDNFGRMVGLGVAAGTGAIVISRVLPAWRERGWAALLPHAHARTASSDALRLPADGAPARSRDGARRDMPWAGALALAWPFMPKAVTSRVTPRVAAFVISLGLPLVAGRRAAPRTRVRSAPHVDLQRYTGRWYEIARLPLRAEARCAANSSALYRLRGDGTLSIVNRCLTRSGAQLLTEGSARIVPRSNGSQLEVSFAPAWLRWLPTAWSHYWILRVDDDYRSALVGTPDHKHLWLLSRTPRMAGSDWQRLVEHAAAEGYDTDRLRPTRQSQR